VSKSVSKLPLEIAGVGTGSLLSALELVRGCLKTTSMLWMHALGLPVLNGVIIADWSKSSADAASRFCRRYHFSELLLRIDKRSTRWTRRRGGYILTLSQLPGIVRDLKREGMLAVLLEPVSPYADLYSLSGVTIPDQGKIIIEVVGPGFDASDILRSDIPPHERWEASLESEPPARTSKYHSAKRVHVATSEQYERSVQSRLAKIGARVENPAFPDTVLKSQNRDSARLIELGIGYLKSTRQTTLLKHKECYVPIPEKHVHDFTSDVQKLLAGLSAYGIHLGSSSFAASLVPKRGLVFWDFFPARMHEAAALYPQL
jgi:hypothetical protein